jgi:asparagine synthetase B (glutamine-hydrolysing)
MNHPHHPAHVVHHPVHHVVKHEKPEPKSHEAELFVGLNDPAAFRKPLLEAARIAIAAGRVQEHLHNLQDRKLALRSELAVVVKDLHHEVTRLQMILPFREVKETAVVAPKAKPIEHRVDKIAAALAEIEARMKEL